MQFVFSMLSLRRFVFFLGALAMFSLLSGCGKHETPVETGNRTQTLHIVRGSEPQELDPHVVIGQTESQIMMSLLEGLVTEDPVDLHPVPGVAESWDISPDHKVYTFHFDTTPSGRTAIPSPPRILSTPTNER